MKKSVATATPVTGGMGDIEAGEAFSSYLESMDGDLSIFEDDASVESPANPSSAEKRAQKKPSTEEQVTADTDEEIDDEELSTAASDEDDEETEDDDDTEEQGDEDDAETETLEGAQLAAVLGLDEHALTVTDDGVVKIRYRVDGEDGEATLPELVKGYQLEAHVTKKSQQLAEERKGLREQITQREQELANAIQQTTALGQVVRDRVLAKYSKVDWDKLAAENPGQYSALNIQLSNELGAIDHEMQTLQEMTAQQVQQSQAEAEKIQSEWLAEQQAKLYEHLPMLRDPDARTPILREYQSYLEDVGFNADEIRTIADHRLLRVVNDAVAGRKATAGAKSASGVPVEKKLAKVPKVLPGGASMQQSKTARRGSKRKAAFTRLRQSGSDTDAARFAVQSGLVDHLL